MKITDIDKAIEDLERTMSDKGLTGVCVSIKINASKRRMVDIGCEQEVLLGVGNKPSTFQWFFGDDLPQLISDAHDVIAALPDPDIAAKQTFQRNLANVIDEGNALNMPNEVMAPLHQGSQALTENLLTYAPEDAQ